MRKESAPTKRGLFVLSVFVIALVSALAGAVAVIPKADSSLGMSREKRVALAHTACADENWVRAEEFLRTLLSESPSDISLRLLMGRVLVELGKLTQARTIFDAVHKESPTTPEAVLGLGRIHEAQAELDHAVACYRRVTEMRPSDARAFRLLALCQLKKGDSMAAMFSMRQSLKIQPGQEDLSKLLNDIGASRQARMDLPPTKRSTNPFDPFEGMGPRGSDRRGMMPSPSVPDPLEGLPRPGGGRSR